MTEQMNGAALRSLAEAVLRVAERRVGVMSTYEVANLLVAHEQLARFAGSIKPAVLPSELGEPLRLTDAEADSFHAAMQDPQPTVQVPVSLIEDVASFLEGLGMTPILASELRATLSQPTPTDEPIRRVVRSDTGYWPIIDPSTIRDVTPPARRTEH